MAMASARNVHLRGGRRKRSATRTPRVRAGVQHLGGGRLGSVADDVRRSRGHGLWPAVVNTWVTIHNESVVGGWLPEHVRWDDGSVVLVKRPGAGLSPVAATLPVGRTARGRACVSFWLYAKLYLWRRERGRGLAVIGSAAATAASRRPQEIAAPPCAWLPYAFAAVPPTARVVGTKVRRGRSSRLQRRRYS